MKISISRQQLEKALGPYHESIIEKISFPPSIEVEVEVHCSFCGRGVVATGDYRKSFPTDPTICRNKNCKLDHERVCNRIECNYVEMQPHLHHYNTPPTPKPPKIEEVHTWRTPSELANKIRDTVNELIRRENQRHGY